MRTESFPALRKISRWLSRAHEIIPVLVLSLMPLVAGGSELSPIFSPGERILFQGDSITDGNRGRNQDPNHILGHGYVFLIASQYGEACAERHLIFINRGVSGNTSATLAQRWQADTLDLKPDVVSVLVGINDLLFNGGHPVMAEDYEKIYDQMLADTVAANAKVKLVLCEPFVLPGKNTTPHWNECQAKLKQFQAVVEKLGAKYHAPVVHFQKIFDAAAKRDVPADYWIWDGVHPTYSGHQLMAQEWIRVYNEFYGAPLFNPSRNPAIAPVPKLEQDSYNWYARHAAVLAWQKKVQPEIVLIGDSITHFWGGEPLANHSNGAKAWTNTFGGHAVLNLGFGWDRTQNVLWRLDHGEMDGLAPRTIVLNIGCNNFSGTENAEASSPEQVCAAIQIICEKLRAKSPASRIIVMGVFPRGGSPSDPPRALHRKLNELLAAVFAGRSNVSFLDIGARFLEPDGSLSREMFFDGTHPTDKGYQIWGHALVEAGAVSESSAR